MSKNLLVYTTIANIDDTIKYSVLIDPETKKASMPSLVIMLQGGEDCLLADNPEFLITELLPALRARSNRTMSREQENITSDFMKEGHLTENDLPAIIEILEYAIQTNLLTETM